MKENVLLGKWSAIAMLELQRVPFAGWALTKGKWSAIAMLELQRIRFAGWELTEGRRWPKASKKKRTREAGLFFLVPTSQVMLHPKWVKKPFPDPVRSPILSALFGSW